MTNKITKDGTAQWLPKLFAGEIKFSISMSEPDAGSDIGAMRTTAVRDGNEWVIDGQKIWASMAGAYEGATARFSSPMSCSTSSTVSDAPGCRTSSMHSSRR